MSDDVPSNQHGRPYPIDNIQAFKGLGFKDKPAFSTIRPTPLNPPRVDDEKRADYYLQRMRQSLAGIKRVQ
jgi:hypothetical protein